MTLDLHPLRHPSAFLPVTMSLAALALVFGYAAIHGVTREQDEGAAVHVFQLLMMVQVLVVVYFVVGASMARPSRSRPPRKRQNRHFSARGCQPSH